MHVPLITHGPPAAKYVAALVLALAMSGLAYRAYEAHASGAPVALDAAGAVVAAALLALVAMQPTNEAAIAYRLRSDA